MPLPIPTPLPIPVPLPALFSGRGLLVRTGLIGLGARVDIRASDGAF